MARKVFASKVIGILPEKVSEKITALSVQYETNLGISANLKLPPHIPIIGEFTRNLSTGDAVWLQECIFHAKVDLTGVYRFSDGTENGLYIGCESDELIDVRNRVLEHFVWLRPDFKHQQLYIPVVQHVPDEIVHQALSFLEHSETGTGSFHINKLHLFVMPTPGVDWEPYQSINGQAVNPSL